MTATADRYGSSRSREELRLVELASGLLLLLDAYRLTGRLPLEIQIQTSRLRHAVKLVIQAEAARTATRPPTPLPTTSRDQAAALQAWIATQPWVQPGPAGWVYLLCFRDPTTGAHRPLVGNGCRGQYAGHYWGWTDDLIRRINHEHSNPRWRGAGHPGPRAAAQEPRLGLPALPTVPRDRRPPRPGRRRGCRPAFLTPPPPSC